MHISQADRVQNKNQAVLNDSVHILNQNLVHLKISRFISTYTGTIYCFLKVILLALTRKPYTALVLVALSSYAC